MSYRGAAKRSAVMVLFPTALAECIRVHNIPNFLSPVMPIFLAVSARPPLGSTTLNITAEP